MSDPEYVAVLRRLIRQQAGEYAALCHRLKENDMDAGRIDALFALGVLGFVRDRAELDAMFRGLRELREKV